MTNTKTTKRALLMSVMALFLCVTMLMGTTYAWFTDSVTSANNKIVAGTLDVQLWMHNGTEYVDISDSTQPLFGADDDSLAVNDPTDTVWEPGKTQVVYLSIRNGGNLDLKYQVALNVTNVEKNLNEVMQYVISPDAKPDNDKAVDEWDGTNAKNVASGINTDVEDVILKAGQEHYFALSVHMDEDAGNEYMNGSITFDMVVLAGQLSSEFDSFDNLYDEKAIYPQNAFGSTPVDDVVVEFDVYGKSPVDNSTPLKVANVKVPKAALVDGADTVSSTVVAASEVYANVVVNSDQGAQTFDISVSNIKEGNTEPIAYALRVGTGLTGVSLWHYDEDVTNNADYAVYYDGEYLNFQTTDFSPFTVVYDAEPKAEDEEELDTTVPVAIVTDSDENENVALDWTGWGGFNPAAGDAQQLSSVYLFKAPHTTTTAQKNIYKDWYCDYYVKFVPVAGSDMTKLPEGSITLGGNYGGYGWVGFDNPEVDVNTFIPLLGSVLGNVDESWTYYDVVGLVQQFWCGVAVANGNTAGDLTGAQFVVELRLTNPDDLSETIAVNTVTYTFGTGESVIENYEAE